MSNNSLSAKTLPQSMAMFATLVTGSLLISSVPATAANLQWNFNFSLDNGQSASGTFTTQDTPSGGPYLITSINGSQNGTPMQLVSETLSPGFGGFSWDNLLSPGSPNLNSNGIGYQLGSVFWNVYFFSGNYAWGNENNIAGGTVTSFSVQQVPVPEPSTIFGLLAAGSIGVLSRKRKG